MYKLLFLNIVCCVLQTTSNKDFFTHYWNPYDRKYGFFSEAERVETLQGIKEMFYFGYDNYMTHAYPLDELDPIHCTGRGPDYDDPSNININDVLGDYSLTLVDTLDTLAIIGNGTEFKRAVQLVVDSLDFKNSTVQVFEATIRVMGGLLSAHMLILDPEQPFGNLRPEDYDNELLHIAHDLATRLITAFDNTATGIPYPRVNLQHGVPHDCINETCTAGAGTLVLEFGILSRLLGDPTFEAAARRAVNRLFKFRSNVTGLFGNVINIQTGEWTGKMSGVGAGLDSFFEYLLKSYIMFGQPDDLRKFNHSYETIKYHMRKGRLKCNKGMGHVPLYVNVHMTSGELANYWVDALQAAWAGVQVLHGDIQEAICSHAVFYTIWKKYSFLPERFNWQLGAPDVSFYPLRPELIESTYFLYQATKHPFYLHVGRDIYESINKHTKAECGYCTVHDVKTRELEDRMESFFLSETFVDKDNHLNKEASKYLLNMEGHVFLKLFDKDNHLNKEASKYLFNTEGHVFRLSSKFHETTHQMPYTTVADLVSGVDDTFPVVDARTNVSSTSNCDKLPSASRYSLPLHNQYMEQLDNSVGVDLLS